MLASPLYVVCDAELCASRGWDLAEYAAACFDGGATLVQIRAKRLASRDLLTAAAAILRRAEAVRATVIVNDRGDIARMAGAAGVHVGQDDLTPLQARAVVGHDAIVGLSTHTAEQLDAALRQPINYVAVGPVFDTATKTMGYEALGLEAVRAAASMASSRRLPLVCIGGVTLERARSVIEAGAQSVAVISDLLTTGRPALRVQELLYAHAPWLVKVVSGFNVATAATSAPSRYASGCRGSKSSGRFPSRQSDAANSQTAG